MKHLPLLIFTILLSLPIYAFEELDKKLNLDCLKETTIFTMKDENGNYTNDPMLNVTLSMRKKGKILILESDGPHVMWSRGGVTIKLVREKDYFIDKKINFKITPLCEYAEFFAEYLDGDYTGVLFKKVK